jgi:hypothetical protein
MDFDTQIRSMEALISKMYDNLEAYAAKPGASELSIRIRNEEIDRMADFVNQVKQLDENYERIYLRDLKIENLKLQIQIEQMKQFIALFLSLTSKLKKAA